MINNEQEFNSYSLLNELPDLMKDFQQNFEISTNNGKYKFNKDLIVRLIPNIQEALVKGEYLNEYHFDINDEQKVMQKIENLFKGESVEFLRSEEKTIKQITSYFSLSTFPIQMYSIDKFSSYVIDKLKDDETKFPEKITIQINLTIFIKILKNSPKIFKIKTNQNEYMCNPWGIFSSKKILTYLQSNPTSTEFYFDFDELDNDIQPIIRLFNWKKLKINSNKSDTILSIAEKLEITTLVDQIKQIIKKVEENQPIIDPYDELFENLFNINKIGIEKVAHFIIKSKWSATKSDVQEFVACLHQVIKTSLFLHPFIFDLIQMLSKSSSKLSSLVDILSNRFLSGLRPNDMSLIDYDCPTDNSYGFLYQMTRRNLVSTEVVIRKIVQSKDSTYCAFQTSSLQSLNPILWFFPEFYDDKRFSREFLLDFIKKKSEIGKNNIFGILSQEKIDQIIEGYCTDDILKEIVSKVRLLRDGCVQTNQLIKSIQNDDIDTFQSFVIDNLIDLSKSMQLTIFEGIQDEITFIDYSAFCGSIKCFKYLFLEKVSITKDTYSYAVKGGNSEIIRIIDQNKGYNDYWGYYSIKSAIVYHRDDIFDWLLENSGDIQSFNDLFTTAIENGNGHVISRVYENVNLKDIDKRSLISMIVDACKNGFYKIVHFLSKWISFEDFFDPLKKTFTDHFFSKEYIFTLLIKGVACSGNLKIFELILENMKEKYSVVLRDAVIEATKIGSIEIVKYILEDKAYQLSEASFVDALCNSIENGCDELIDYFIEQKKDLPLITEIISSACKAQNVNLVKKLIQDANEKGISIDYTKPFIKAVSPYSEEIVKLFIELKVDLDYEEIFSNLKEIALVNRRVIFLLINETKIEIKDRLIKESFKVAISTNNIEILKFLISRKYEFKDLLINAAIISNLEVIKIILELNHSEEYINRVGKNGTALFEVVRSPTNKMISQMINSLPNVYREPLYEEIVKQKNEIVEYLLKQKGIDPSISIDSINTPLVEAARNGNVGAVGLILDFYGDHIKDQGKQIYDAIEVITKNQFNFTENDKMNLKQLLKIRKLAQYNVQEDILYIAIMKDDTDLASELLDNDQSIDFSKRFANGDTYLHLSINDKFNYQISNMCRLLINHPKIDINSQNWLDETPLVKAIKCENEVLAELILNHPKFDAKLSLIDYAFLLSVKLENIFMKIIQIESLDVNYNHVTTVSKDSENSNGDQSEPKDKITTPLIEAVKTGNLQIVKAIINHSSFDPIKSQILTCLITAIKMKNLELFKFFMELNGGDINLKNIRNKSLLCYAASSGGNPEILKEILGNEKFDPIKSDIQKSFINSSDSKSRKILISYDEENKTNFLNFDKIHLLFSFHNKIKKYFGIDPLQLKLQSSYEFLMRKNGLFPMIPSICTSVVSKNKIHQRLYYCKTCYSYNLCEICARVCHKGHNIVEIQCFDSFNSTCQCCFDYKCKCKSISNIYNELYDKFKIIKEEKRSYNRTINAMELDEDKDKDEYIDKNEHNEKDEGCLKCTLDLAGFNSISQPMYRCRNCKADICQSCAIRCHKGHKLIFKGFKNDALCHCLEITDCCCTSRKDVVCTYAFYGNQYVYQSFYNCKSCSGSENSGCCTVCCKKCHHNHNIKFKHRCSCFCDCGADDLPVNCNAMEFPPFNYLSSCTNREQKYQKKMQRLYHCLTCGLTAENQGICEACAIHCHPAHKLVYVGMKEFACECFLLNLDCKAPSCPEISSDGLCNRVKFGKNSFSPVFICESCDKDGKNRICKSCALTCHKGHNVHFLEFSNFECQCNPCKCNENKS